MRGALGAWLEAQLEVLAGALTPLHVDLSEGLLGLGCLDFLTVWRLSSKSKCPQRELSRSCIIIYGLGLEVNITLFLP